MPIMPFLNSILADVLESMYVIDGVPSVRSVNRISILFFAFYWLSSRVLRVKATQIQQPLTHDYISKPKEAAIRIWMRKNALFPRSLKVRLQWSFLGLFPMSFYVKYRILGPPYTSKTPKNIPKLVFNTWQTIGGRFSGNSKHMFSLSFPQ